MENMKRVILRSAISKLPTSSAYGTTHNKD